MGMWSKRNAEIIQKYKDGISVGKLGAEYGITRERVCQILRPHNLTNLKVEQRRVAREEAEAERDLIREQNRLAREGKIAQALDIVRNGGSRNDAIAATGLPVYLIVRACEEAGMPHNHGRWNREDEFQERISRAKELRAQGKTWSEVGRALGIRSTTLYNFIVRYAPELKTRNIVRARRATTPRTPVMSDDEWTPDQVSELCRLYFSGCSAQQIADIMGIGFSRNSVIGKTNRLRAARQLLPPRTAT